MIIVINVFSLIVYGIICLGIFFFLLVLFHSWKMRRQRKKYKEDKDLSKHGEEIRRKNKLEFERRLGIEGTNGTTNGRKSIIERLDKSERGELLPTTDVINAGENIHSNRNTNQAFRKFKRLK